MSDIVTTDTEDAAAADADKPRDDTDVLFRDDVDDADDLPTRASRRVVTAWTMVFAALLIAGAGFVAGIQMEKRNAPAAGGVPSDFAAFTRNGGFPGGGTGGFPGGATGGNAASNGAAANRAAPAGGATQAPTSNGTTGQVKLVDGSNIYITTSDGSTVKVATTSAAKVTKATPGAVSDLKAGDTITVQGATGTDGTIAATSISQTP